MIVGDYEAFRDPYCYRGSSCLKNKLKVRDPALLQAFELEMSSLRAEEPLPPGRFDPTHYRRIHRHLFQDVYRWAGRYRTVRTAKDGHWFCFPEYIEREMNLLFATLKSPTLLPGASELNFVNAAARFLAELNAIHPFREGNGRTQMAFLHLVALRAEHLLDLDRIRPDSFLKAMIESFDGRIESLVAQLRAILS